MAQNLQSRRRPSAIRSRSRSCAGRCAAIAGRDGGADRAHRDVAVHPREEGLLRRAVRRRRPAGRRLDAAGLRRHRRPDRSSTYPLRDDAAGRSLLVQRLLRLEGRGLALARPGVRRAGVRRRRARRLLAGLGAFQRHRRHARRLAVAGLHRHLPGGHRSSRRCGSRARACRTRRLLRHVRAQLALSRRWCRATLRASMAAVRLGEQRGWRAVRALRHGADDATRSSG